MDQSMSDKGNCYDNACCESFFCSLKRELMPDSGYLETRRKALVAIFNISRASTTQGASTLH